MTSAFNCDSQLLRLVRVSKHFFEGDNKVEVLNEVDFAVAAGQVTAVIGHSGSGKSTLLHILGLLEKASGGQVLLMGQECSSLTDNKLSYFRSNYLGFVYQSHHLLPEFSAIENLEIAQMVKASKAVNRSEAAALLAMFGLESKIHCYPSELSGGEKQRVAVARALINNPKILLADEPTGNLDQDNAELVFDMMMHNVRALNLSAVIVTHNLVLAKRADRVFLLEKGKLRSYDA